MASGGRGFLEQKDLKAFAALFRRNDVCGAAFAELIQERLMQDLGTSRFAAAKVLHARDEYF